MSDERIPFRGGLACSCIVESLPWVELDMILQGVITDEIDIYQLAYQANVPGSAGTHLGGGNIDVVQCSEAAIRIWRKWGWAMQYRSKSQGFDPPHGHGWPYGCPHLSDNGIIQSSYDGADQLRQWKAATNGLASRGPIEGPYPIKTWNVALKENKMAVLDEVVKAVQEALNKDNVVNTKESVLTGNPKNPGVAVATALDYIGRRVMSIRKNGASKADIKRLEAKIDALAKKV